MKIYEDLEICRTGKLKQYYTLYEYKTISTDVFHNEVYHYIQNLSFNEKDAFEKAKKIKSEKEKLHKKENNYSCGINIVETPRREYCNLKAFGLEWKKSAKGFYVYMGQIDKETSSKIFATWKKNKDQLKKAGFRLFKTDSGEWMFFFRNCSDEEMAERLDALKLEDAPKKVAGDFVGNVGDRIKIKCTIERVRVVGSKWGAKKLVIFKDGDNVLATFYSGTKAIPENGTEVSLTGTVKAHNEYNGQNQTVLTRIIIKEKR